MSFIEKNGKPSRAPGDVKPSWKWSLDMKDDPKTVRRCKEALAQVNFYMEENDARYGFLLTDKEFVALKSMPQGGCLEPAAVSWNGSAESALTVLLAYWYIGMLASSNDPNDGWNLENPRKA